MSTVSLHKQYLDGKGKR